MGATPQPPRNHPDGSGFVRWMKGIESQLSFIRERLNNPFANTGMSSVSPGVLQVSGDVRLVDGTGALMSSSFNGTDFAHPGTAGNYFGDDGVVLNNAYFRPGSVSNDALTSPVVPGQAFQGASTFALSVAGANIITITRTVPAGFTAVVVNAYGRVAATNSTASKDAVYSAVDVNGTGGNQFGNEVAAGDFGSVSAGYSTLLTGLTTGASVATHLYASTGLAGWASNSSNGADLSVTYLWFR